MTILDKAPSNKAFTEYDFIAQCQATKEKTEYGSSVVLPDPVKWEIKCDMGQTGNVPVQFHGSTKQLVQKQLAGMSCNAGIYRSSAQLMAVLNLHDSLFYIAGIGQLIEMIEKYPQIRKIIANKHKPEQTGIALIPKSLWKERLYTLLYYADEHTEI